MNWNQLQYVITIAEEKSITKAAQKLYISQPSLSLSIQALEKETGIPLFERNRGEMKLTYAGSLFYEWAISTLHSHTQLEWKLGDIVSGSRTLIRLGLSPTEVNGFWHRFWNAFIPCMRTVISRSLSSRLTSCGRCWKRTSWI